MSCGASNTITILKSQESARGSVCRDRTHGLELTPRQGLDACPGGKETRLPLQREQCAATESVRKRECQRKMPMGGEGGGTFCEGTERGRAPSPGQLMRPLRTVCASQPRSTHGGLHQRVQECGHGVWTYKGHTCPATRVRCTCTRYPCTATMPVECVGQGTDQGADTAVECHTQPGVSHGRAQTRREERRQNLFSNKLVQKHAGEKSRGP